MRPKPVRRRGEHKTRWKKAALEHALTSDAAHERLDNKQVSNELSPFIENSITPSYRASRKQRSKKIGGEPVLPAQLICVASTGYVRSVIVCAMVSSTRIVRANAVSIIYVDGVFDVSARRLRVVSLPCVLHAGRQRTKPRSDETKSVVRRIDSPTAFDEQQDQVSLGVWITMTSLYCDTRPYTHLVMHGEVEASASESF